jgi:hypothetical protein
MTSDNQHRAATPPDDGVSLATQRQIVSRRWWAVISGTFAAIASVAIGLMFFAGGRLPTIDQARFDAAQKLWHDKGPANYDLEVAVSEIEPAVYKVSVRGGDVTSATRNGTPLTQRRTLGGWSVPGMFRTISIDLKHATDPIQVGPHDVNYVTPQGQFDPQYGYPMRYRRIQWGSDYEISWRVTNFEVVKP